MTLSLGFIVEGENVLSLLISYSNSFLASDVNLESVETEEAVVAGFMRDCEQLMLLLLVWSPGAPGAAPELWLLLVGRLRDMSGNSDSFDMIFKKRGLPFSSGCTRDV